MSVYIAPEIKDRVAVGDDLYQITDSGGKKKLTPDPTEVSEAGTAINKALLQPMADTLQELSEGFVPYGQYWWRRRAVASSYSETRQNAVGYGYSHTSNGTTYYMLGVKRYVRGADEESGTDYYATLQYAKSIAINQTTGAISLSNPSTYTVTGSEAMYDSSFYGRFRGKYVKGFLGETGTVFYIPSSASTTTHNWETSAGDITNESGFEFTKDTSESCMPLKISSVKNTATGMWESISSDTSDTYPQSGISGGYEWVYCGKIGDFAPLLFPLKVATVNITSASWNNSTYSLQLPCTRYMLWTYEGVQLLVDNGKAYGSYTDYESYSYDQQTNFAAGATSISVGDHTAESAAYELAFTASGITVTQGRKSSITLAYLPLP